MKKYFIYFLVFVIIIFIVPALCTKKSVETISSIEERERKNAEKSNNDIVTNDEEQNVESYDYSKFEKIKLYHKSTGEIEELPIDEYLYGTVSAEMPVNYELEALKAQAIVARTYTLYQIINGNSKHGEADICDDSTCCQAWISKESRMEKWSETEREDNWNKIVKAVNETSGKIITYEGKPIDAFFHANSGGTTETAANVWGGNNFPYLQSVETSGESEYSQYSSEVTITKEELVNKLKEEFSDFEINFDNEEPIKILEYTESGRVKTIKFGNTELAGTKARSLLGLKSTNFSFTIDGDNIIFSVTGYGHGVGMSQTGADSMAKSGSSCEDIIKHFYTGVDIMFVNDLS